MKRIQLLALPLFVVLMGIALLLPLSAWAASSAASSTSPGTLTAPVKGTIPSINGTFSGHLVPTQFVRHGNALSVTGTLKGTLKNANGQVIGNVTQTATFPVTAGSGTCPILHLHTGAITLTLLGLTVNISPITITITANSSGGLLGELLCDIDHLLGNGVPLGSLAGLLNQVLAALGL